MLPEAASCDLLGCWRSTFQEQTPQQDLPVHRHQLQESSPAVQLGTPPHPVQDCLSKERVAHLQALPLRLAVTQACHQGLQRFIR